MLNQSRKCPTHGTLGAFPCAWPGCPNGLAADEFEEELFIETAEPLLWKRQQLESPFGGLYFSWESNQIANWFHTAQTFWNEVRRLRLVSETPPELIYHYTSLDGFLGIVNSRSIWMTDFAYLNDYREARYGLDLLLEAINDMRAKTVRSDVQNLLSVWKEKLGMSTSRVYIASFSGDSDSLNQWRGYGPIAIGFPVQSLAIHMHQSRLQPVEYDPLTQKKLVKAYVHHLVCAYVADINDNKLEQVADAYHKSDRLLEFAVFLKDPAFRSENEYRLVNIDYPDAPNHIGFLRPPRLFRAANRKIVPYVASADILNANHWELPLEIAEVVLGPESDELLERGVREFLNERGFSNVYVRRSLVPFRS